MKGKVWKKLRLDNLWRQLQQEIIYNKGITYEGNQHPEDNRQQVEELNIEKNYV